MKNTENSKTQKILCILFGILLILMLVVLPYMPFLLDFNSDSSLTNVCFGLTILLAPLALCLLYKGIKQVGCARQVIAVIAAFLCAYCGYRWGMYSRCDLGIVLPWQCAAAAILVITFFIKSPKCCKTEEQNDTATQTDADVEE